MIRNTLICLCKTQTDGFCRDEAHCDGDGGDAGAPKGVQVGRDRR